MKSEFDDYAGSYDSALNQGLSLSGESKSYFAHERVRWLAARLSDLGAPASRVLDYGCGTGDTSPELLAQLRATMVVGVRQALDFTSTGRAVVVCLIGWLLSALFVVVLGMVFGSTVT